jgi:hypothetical protein
MYPPVSARQRLDKNITAATNTQATIEELLDASFSMRSVSFQREVDDYFFPEILVNSNTSTNRKCLDSIKIEFFRLELKTFRYCSFHFVMEISKTILSLLIVRLLRVS